MTEKWNETWGTLNFASLGGADIERCVFDKKWNICDADMHEISVLQHLLRLPVPNVGAIYTAVQLGADVNSKDVTGVCALQDLAGVLNTDERRALTAYFLAKGANPKVADIDLRTPLHSMTFMEDDVCVRMLLCAGALVNAQDASGDTPLSDTIYNRGCDVARALLDYGASITIPNCNNETPLTKVSQWGDQCTVNKVQMLIREGYQLKPENMLPKAPIIIARKTRQILQSLQQQRG